MTNRSKSHAAGQAAKGNAADGGRVAIASGQIQLAPETVALFNAGAGPLGDVLAVARVAGIMAAKRTGELIPLRYAPRLTSIMVEINPSAARNAFMIEATAKTTGPSDPDMEALTAVTVAALTLHDMAKADDLTVVIGEIKLISRTSGHAGTAAETPPPPAEEKEKPKLVSRGFRRSPGALVSRTRALEPAAAAAGAATISRVEACRRFMRDNKLQVTAWASLAGLPPGLVYGFLHGRVGRLPKDSEERLARAANATVPEVFGAD